MFLLSVALNIIFLGNFVYGVLQGFWSLEVVFHLVVFLFFETSLYREVFFVVKVKQLYIREIKIVFLWHS